MEDDSTDPGPQEQTAIDRRVPIPLAERKRLVPQPAAPETKAPVIKDWASI